MEDGAGSPSHWFHSCTLLWVRPGDATLPRRWQQAEELATSHERPRDPSSTTKDLSSHTLLPRAGGRARGQPRPALSSSAHSLPSLGFFSLPNRAAFAAQFPATRGTSGQVCIQTEGRHFAILPQAASCGSSKYRGLCRSQGSPAFSASPQGTVTALRAGTEGPRPPRGVVGHRQRKDDGSRSTDQLTQSRAVPRGKGRRPRSRAEDGSGDEHEGSRTPAWPRGCRASPERWHLAPSSCT